MSTTDNPTPDPTPGEEAEPGPETGPGDERGKRLVRPGEEVGADELPEEVEREPVDPAAEPAEGDQDHGDHAGEEPEGQVPF